MADFEDSIAHKAHGLVHGERAKTYGHPRFDFTAIAKVWTGLLQDLLKDDAQLDAYRISILMTGLKLCRLVKSPQHKDSRIDTIGYMLTMERLDEPETVDWDTVKMTVKDYRPQESATQDHDENCRFHPTVADLRRAEPEESVPVFKLQPGAQTFTVPEGVTEAVFETTQDHDENCRFHPTVADLRRAEHSMQEDLEEDDADEELEDSGHNWARESANQLTYSQVKVWFDAGETKYINGDAHTNVGGTGKLMVFPFLPGTEVTISPFPTFVGDSEHGDFPKFGTPEFDAKAAEVAAEQAKDWPKPEHAHLQQQPCMPPCPVWVEGRPKFEFTGEKVEMKPSNPWDRND